MHSMCTHVQSHTLIYEWQRKQQKYIYEHRKKKQQNRKWTINKSLRSSRAAHSNSIFYTHIGNIFMVNSLWNVLRFCDNNFFNQSLSLTLCILYNVHWSVARYCCTRILCARLALIIQSGRKGYDFPLECLSLPYFRVHARILRAHTQHTRTP